MPGFRAPIDLGMLDSLIVAKGVWVDWYRTTMCPCISDSGYPSRGCLFCDSLGWIREAPKRIKGLLTAHNPKKDKHATGVVETGIRQFTPPRRIRLAEGDWVKMRQFPLRTSQIIVYGAPEGADDRLEALFPYRVRAVKLIRDGLMIIVPPSAYTDITDPLAPVTVAGDGALQWQLPDPGMPFPGEQLSVEYEYHEAYQVFRGEMPMNRGTESNRLPDRAMLKLITRRKLRSGPVGPSESI